MAAVCLVDLHIPKPKGLVHFEIAEGILCKFGTIPPLYHWLELGNWIFTSWGTQKCVITVRLLGYYTGVYCSNLLILFQSIGWIISTFSWKYFRDFNINNFRDLYFVSKFHNLPKFDGGFWEITFTKHY